MVYLWPKRPIFKGTIYRKHNKESSKHRSFPLQVGSFSNSEYCDLGLFGFTCSPISYQLAGYVSTIGPNPSSNRFWMHTLGLGFRGLTV